jgi:cysteine desulfurase
MAIYLDNAATTAVDPRVLKTMQPYFNKNFGNASSLHAFGQRARTAIEDSRKKIAMLINAEPEEIIFTSGGTESNNLAIKGLAWVRPNKKHVIISAIEHDAVLKPCEWLRKQGYEITVLPVDKHGMVDPKAVERAIRSDTLLVSIMHANNEIGTIQPIEKIGAICKAKGVYFHTDAAQTFGKIPVHVDALHVDLLSASSHKIHGPKGVGCLYVRKGVPLVPLLHGGGHEFGLRSGTENVAGIVGFGEAAKIAQKEMKADAKRLTALRDKLIKEVLKIPDSWLNGHPKQRLPGNANFGFRYIEGEALILQLDVHGIAVSTGSACSSKSLEPSHVLLALGLKHEEAHGSLRVSLGKFNKRSDIDALLKVLPKTVERLRTISPFKRKIR